jgi:hypothetical protein
MERKEKIEKEEYKKNKASTGKCGPKLHSLTFQNLKAD